MAALPKHFSLMSAQKGPDHDDQAHKGLISDLKSLGLKVIETDGKYGYPEKSVMVEHLGREEDRTAIDALGRKYQQQAVLHCSYGASKGSAKGAHHNELRFMDGRPSVFGKGYRIDPSLEDSYTIHPKIGKFQMHLDFSSQDASKGLGVISGQTAAAGPEPKPAPAAMPIQARANNPARVATKSKKTLIAKADLVKAMMHQDGETMVDSRSHAAASGPMPQVMMDWGAQHLVPMKINDIRHLRINDYLIKVTKKSPDLYAGWVEHEANIGHKFERLTMPQLLLQLHSALELYGREDQILNTVVVHSDQAEEEPQPEKKKELTEIGQAISEALDETKDASEADKQAKIREKLEALRAKIKEETIPAKDLAEGLEEPEQECPACESQSEECSCYEGLSRPRLEFDGKKVTIFFKSDWSPEDKDNFKQDLKRRAGIILRKREEARLSPFGDQKGKTKK